MGAALSTCCAQLGLGTALSAYHVGVLVAVLAALGYRASLPTPIPGIPHHRHAAGRPFGDVWGMVVHTTRTGRVLVSVVCVGGSRGVVYKSTPS
jgi:hypothetical protein